MLSLKDLDAAKEEIYTELLEHFGRQKEEFINHVRLHAQADFTPLENPYQEWITDRMNEIRGQAKFLRSLGALSDEDYELEMADFHIRSIAAIHEFNHKKRLQIHAW